VAGASRPKARFMSSRAHLRHVGAVALAALIWSTSYAATKRLLNDVPPLTAGALRFCLAALLLALIVHTAFRRVKLSRTEVLRHSAAGLLGITGFFVFENLGLKLSTAADAALIVAAQPLIAMMLEFAFARISFNRARLVGVLLAMVGVGFIVQNAQQVGGGARLVGDLLMLGSSVVFAIFSFVSRRSGGERSLIRTTYYQTLTGATAFLLIAVVFEGGAVAEVPSGESFLWIVYLAVVCSIGGFLFYNYGLRGLSSSGATNILNIVPVFGVISAVVIAGERTQLTQIVGGLIVVQDRIR
jgi:drug/metabolite transporter (DMT)-like permease